MTVLISFISRLPWSAGIRAELNKQKVALRVVATADEADVVMTGSATKHDKRSWHEGWLTNEHGQDGGQRRGAG